MKRILLAIILACSPVIYTACTAPVSERVAAVHSLKAVGHTAESAVETAAVLYRDGHITEAQLKQVTTFYDDKFQPSYRVAVLAAKSDLSFQAPDQLAALASQLAALVVSFQSR